MSRQLIDRDVTVVRGGGESRRPQPPFDTVEREKGVLYCISMRPSFELRKWVELSVDGVLLAV